MNNDYVKLVENHNTFLTDEDKTINQELSFEDQQSMFKGWSLGKASDDVDFLNNEINIVIEDFKDDILKAYSEDAISLEENDFLTLLNDIKGKLTDENSQEPTDDEDDDEDDEETDLENELDSDLDMEPEEDSELISPEDTEEDDV